MPDAHRSSRVQFRGWAAAGHQFKHKAFSSASVATAGEFLQPAEGPAGLCQKTTFEQLLEMNRNPDWRCFGAKQKVYEKRK